MLENIEWLFFDVGSTLVDEHVAYEHRMREIAESAGTTYEKVYEAALKFYRQNKKGDLETAKLSGAALPEWHGEDEMLYDDTIKSLEILSGRYKIGVIANQPPGTRERLKKHGILQYMDVIVASAEEGAAKPDRKIFETALRKSNCKAEHSVMIGDRIDNDIVPANLLGMHTIWIKQGFGQYWRVKREIEKADAVVHSLIEICGIL